MNVLTRAEAERIVRKIIANHAGEPMEQDLFKRSVADLLKAHNEEGATEIESVESTLQ